jgi:hypothetical protein
MLLPIGPKTASLSLTAIRSRPRVVASGVRADDWFALDTRPSRVFAVQWRKSRVPLGATRRPLGASEPSHHRGGPTGRCCWCASWTRIVVGLIRFIVAR